MIHEVFGYFCFFPGVWGVLVGRIMLWGSRKAVLNHTLKPCSVSQPVVRSFTPVPPTASKSTSEEVETQIQVYQRIVGATQILFLKPTFIINPPFSSLTSKYHLHWIFITLGALCQVLRMQILRFSRSSQHGAVFPGGMVLTSHLTLLLCLCVNNLDSPSLRMLMGSELPQGEGVDVSHWSCYERQQPEQNWP